MTNPGRKKVLILTYYWPPSGGAGVQRWLKFTKYMREFDYEPVIYTAEDPEYPSIDESLSKDIPENITVLKTRAWEPYKLYKLFTSQKKGHRVNTGFLNEEKKSGLTEKISVWIRGNLFIPDARKYWIKPSIRFLSNYLKDNPVDVIVSTGPPHSMHLIALGVSRRTNIPWVADFRDPWTKIDFYQELMLSRIADRQHHKLEKSVLENASAVTVINQDMKDQFEKLGIKNVSLITNGFDPDDFKSIAKVSNANTFDNKYSSPETDIIPAHGHSDGASQIADKIRQLDPEFSITHIGTIVPSRNPVALWKVLSELIIENEDFARDLKIKLVGAIDISVSASIEETNLGNWSTTIEYLPHAEAVSILEKSQVLLLLVNNTPNAKGILTGKLFEYLKAGRPILAIGPPDGETSRILENTKSGHILNFKDRRGLKKQILDYYTMYREGKLNIDAQNIEKFSRKKLTQYMTEIFNEVIR